MHKINKMHLIGFIILLMLSLNSESFSANKGKIAGRIVEATTGDPLIGANVIIEGTTLGAAADTDGNYFILNISPGKYNLKCTMVGYTTVIQNDVEVNSNQTVKVNFSLETGTLKSEEVIVTAKKPVVQLDVSSSKKIISSKSIQSRPVENFEELLGTEAGIELTSSSDGQGIQVRGGSLNETDIQIDGLSTRNERNQQPMTNLSLTAIEEVEILTGGFNAEYGDIRSGMVTIVTKEGSQEKFSVNMDFRISPAARKHFGPSPYSVDGPYWPVHTGKDAFTGVTQDMVDNGEYEYVFAGWNRVAEGYLTDNNPDNDYTPQELLEIWKYEHRQITYADKPDYIADVTLSGPIPGTPITFMMSERYEDLQIAYPFSLKNSIGSTTLLKFTTHIMPTMKLSFNNMFMYQTGVGGAVYSNTNGMINGSREGTSFAQNNLSESWLFYNGAFNPLTNKQYRGGLSLNHVISNRTYYDIRLEYTNFSSNQEPNSLRDTSKIKQIGDRWYDESPRNYTGPGTVSQGDILDMFSMSGGGRGRDFSKYWGLRLSGDFVSQLNYYNLIKVGFSIDYTDFSERRDVNSGGGATKPYEEAPYHWVQFDNAPIKIGAYIQDKLEYAGMTANVGVRMDYLNTGTSPYNLDPDYIFSHLPYTLGNFQANNNSYSQFTTDGKKYKLYISPRIGISHPVNESSKIFYNYGHFYQPPVIEQLFAVKPSQVGDNSNIPDVSNEWPLTISYEVGFEQSIDDEYLVQVLGYYKDISNQLSPTRIEAFQGIQIVNTYSNNSYADIKGLELKFEKRVGRWWYGFLAFEYFVSSYGRSGLAVIYEDPLLADQEFESATQERGWPTPRLWANITLQSPADFGQLLGGWRLNILQNWSDGGKMLMNPDATVKELHYADILDYWNTDILLEKRFRYGDSMMLSVYMQVKNLFNYKGRVNPYNSNEYYASLHLPWEEGEQKGNDKIGEWDKEHIKIGRNTYSHFINPRDIYVGIKLQF